MSTEITKNTTGDTVWVVHQPGNGTRYEVLLSKIPGSDTSQWLVALPQWGGSYYFNEGGAPSITYLEEKIGRKRYGGKLGIVDLSEIGKVVNMVIPGVQCETITNDSGELDPEVAEQWRQGN